MKPGVLGILEAKQGGCFKRRGSVLNASGMLSKMRKKFVLEIFDNL